MTDSETTANVPFKVRASAWLIHKFLVVLWRTCQVTVREGRQHALALARSGNPFLPCFWHQMQLFGSYFLFDLKNECDYKLGFLISPSKDGEIAAHVVRRLGGEVVRGSSSSTGARALKDCYLAISKKQISLTITADGPRGPLHEFKQGAVVLALMTGAPILPLAFRAKKAWHLNSWDSFIIPKPFSEVEIYVGAPLSIPKDLSAEQLEAKRVEVETILRTLIPAD